MIMILISNKLPEDWAGVIWYLSGVEFLIEAFVISLWIMNVLFR